MTEQTEQTNTPIRLPEPPRDRAERPNDSIVVNQTTFFYFVVAAVFTIAGFIIGWVTATTTINSTVSAVRADTIAAAEQAAKNAVSGIQINAAAPAAVVQPTPTPIPRQVIDIGDSASWGPADAKVTIVTFSDFQCPYCQVFSSQAYPLIKQNYGDKVRFVFKHFPITQSHPQAYGAALASECANEQGKFWEYHDKLFAQQDNLYPASLEQYAIDVGVANLDQFKQCYNSQKYASKVDQDMAAGEGHFVTGTPIFFINGYYMSGARPFAQFKTAIDAALAQAQTATS